MRGQSDNLPRASVRGQFGKTMVELGRKYPDLVVLTADLMYPTRTDGFAKEFPDRFFNVGIAEQNMVGIAAGLAASGKFVFICDYASFTAFRAGEQVRNDIAYPNFNVKICALSCGLTFGTGGPTHQSYEDVAYMRAIPNMTVVVPADALATDLAVKAAAEYEGPVFLRIGRDEEYVMYTEPFEFTIGKAHMAREGSDFTVIANGPMVFEAARAADFLKSEGLSVRVLDMHTVKPIDRDAIVEAACETKGIVTAEEATIYGGLGGAVAEVLAELGGAPRLVRIGIPDVFPVTGPNDEVRARYGLNWHGVMRAVRNLADVRCCM